MKEGKKVMANNGTQTKKRKGKRKMIGWIIALVVVVGLGAVVLPLITKLNKEHAEAANVPIAAVDFAKLPDGAYTGEYAGGMYKWRVNSVKVTVSDGKVTGIEPLAPADPNKKLTARAEMYDRVLKEQTLQVDTVSGATLDSKAYLKGLEAALVQAEGK